MPSAMLRACACGALAEKTPCPACSRQRESRRGTAASRGYDSHWRKFRARFVRMLIAAGIPPVCGAALPDGPQMSASRCRAAGRLVVRSANGEDLHLDHEPPLTDEERKDPRKVCDPRRVGLLCAEDHSAKTLREQRGRS